MKNNKLIHIQGSTDIELTALKHTGQSYDGVIKELLKERKLVA